MVGRGVIAPEPVLARAEIARVYLMLGELRTSRQGHLIGDHLNWGQIYFPGGRDPSTRKIDLSPIYVPNLDGPQLDAPHLMAESNCLQPPSVLRKPHIFE